MQGCSERDSCFTLNVGGCVPTVTNCSIGETSSVTNDQSMLFDWLLVLLHSGKFTCLIYNCIIANM